MYILHYNYMQLFSVHLHSSLSQMLASSLFPGCLDNDGVCVYMYIKFRARGVLQDDISDHLIRGGKWFHCGYNWRLREERTPLISTGCMDMGREGSHKFAISDLATFPNFVDEEDEVQKN